MEKKKTFTLQIFIALVLGVVAGLLLQSRAEFCIAYIRPFGTIFLNLLKFVVVPVVLFSVMEGVLSLRDVGKIGKIGGVTILYYFCTTALAAGIGLFFAGVFKGSFPALETTGLSYEAPERVSFMDTFVGFFPSNFLTPLAEANMLQVIVMAILISFAILLIGGEEGKPERMDKAIDAVSLLSSVFIKCMDLILRLSPIGVFCLLCPVVASNGSMIIGALAKVIACAYAAYLLHAVLVYSVFIASLGKMSPVRFFREMMPAIIFAFSSASSVGTLPVNMECTEKLGVSKEVYSFVLPLGATINMDGTAIYQGVCSVFIASCYGIDLTLTQMAVIVITATLASVGTAGVPGAGVVMLAMVLTSVGLPVEGIALVAGVDRIFDMGRTTLNITGDASCCVIVNRVVSR